jgi:CheY-like chemotaxis protein
MELRAGTGSINAAPRSRRVFAVHRARAADDADDRLGQLAIGYQIRRTGMSLLILVIDDEPDVEVLFRQQFRRDLRAGRFTMDFAQSAPMALQRIADAARVSLILILSDINMPGMSGIDLLPKAKALRPDVPVIMITAYGDAETKRKAFENGAEALLTKPIDFAELRNKIDVRVERAA